jgi:Zn-dependent protease with chaperone function
MDLITLLIYIIVLGLVFYILWWLLGKVGLPEPFNKIATMILALICVLVLLNLLFGILPMPALRLR